MNAPMMLRQQRLARISQVTNLIQKIRDDKKPLKYDMIVMSVVSILGISKKTAIEYIDASLFSLGIEKDTIK